MTTSKIGVSEGGQKTGHFEQKIKYARASLWLPFYAVGMVARIRGVVITGLLENALRKLKILYPPLASRVRLEKDGTAWLTTDGVGEFPLEVRSRTGEEDWSGVLLEQERIPFPFEQGPLARFFLLRDEDTSDLVVILPHVICDGFSMTQVMQDIVVLLNNPEKVVEPSLPPPVVSWQTMPHTITDGLPLKGFVQIVNHLWPGKRVPTNQSMYEEMSRVYWARHQNNILSFDLPAHKTSALVEKCKRNQVAVTSVVITAFLLAQADLSPKKRADNFEVSIPVNLRDRMLQCPENALGVYVSSFNLTFHPKTSALFWQFAREVHVQIHKTLGKRSLLLRPLVMEALDPRIADILVSGLSSGNWSREFGQIIGLLKIRGLFNCLTVSNIGRISLRDIGAPYHLETLLPFPPLFPGSGIALNVLTVNGQMKMILKFQQDQANFIEEIRTRALRYLESA